MIATSSTPAPRILFVPGKNPKPLPREHQAQLWRCLLEGVRRADVRVHSELAAQPEAFYLAAWNHSYYGCYRDISQDLSAIEALLGKPEADALDRREARHWLRRLAQFGYLVADRFPALIPLLPDSKVKASIAETQRYFENRDGIGRVARRPLRDMLDMLCPAGVPFMLIGHSLGSVIAWDALWELSREGGSGCRVDLFLTIGSPLGTHFVQKRLLGHQYQGAARYPANIRRWRNITSVGDLTAFDPKLSDDFSEMLQLGLIEDIQDNESPVYNAFRADGTLNVHRSYGYLANPAVGSVISDWWREQAERPRREPLA